MGKLKLFDVYQAAFLSLRGLPFTLERKGRKVLFVFASSEDAYRELASYTEGARVDAQDFSIELKRLRARIYEAREGSGCVAP